jgi:hypothetical protein
MLKEETADDDFTEIFLQLQWIKLTVIFSWRRVQKMPRRLEKMFWVINQFNIGIDLDILKCFHCFTGNRLSCWLLERRISDTIQSLLCKVCKFYIFLPNFLSRNTTSQKFESSEKLVYSLRLQAKISLGLRGPTKLAVKATALNSWIAVDKRWNKQQSRLSVLNASNNSNTTTESCSLRNNSAELLTGSKVWKASGWKMNSSAKFA